MLRHYFQITISYYTYYHSKFCSQAPVPLDTKPATELELTSVGLIVEADLLRPCVLVFGLLYKLLHVNLEIYIKITKNGSV